MLFHSGSIHLDGKETSGSGAVKGKELSCIRCSGKQALPWSVFFKFSIRISESIFLSAQERFDLFIVLCTDRSYHLGHFHDPVSPELLIDLIVIQVSKVIRKPFILDRKETEKCGFPCPLCSHKAEHFVCFISRLEDTEQCFHHKMLQAFIYHI